jgi:hypothetical protein
VSFNVVPETDRYKGTLGVIAAPRSESDSCIEET